jgi:hypothetical protein
MKVTKADLEIVAKGAGASGLDLDSIRDDFISGKVMTFRITNPGEEEAETAILLIQEQIENSRKIWIYFLLASTRSIPKVALQHNKELSDTLEGLARTQEVHVLRALQIPKLYEHITKPVGWKITRYEVEKEIEYGRQ